MENAGVWSTLQDHGKWPVADGPRDIAGQPRSVARLHEDERVLGDRVLRIGDNARPQRKVLLDDEGRRTADETNSSSDRLTVREHHSAERIAVPRGTNGLTRAAHHDRIG